MTLHLANIEYGTFHYLLLCQEYAYPRLILSHIEQSYLLYLNYEHNIMWLSFP